MMRKGLAAGILVVALSGCGGGRFVWRDKGYELPEEAVAAQKKDLEREVYQVAPFLEEQRIRGKIIVAIPTEMTLRARLFPVPDPDKTEDQFFASSLAQNLLAARVEALNRAKVFDAVDVKVRERPESTLWHGYDWLATFGTWQKGAEPAWRVASTKTLALEEPPFTPEDAKSREHCDRFVSAVRLAAEASQAKEKAPQPWVNAAWPLYKSEEIGGTFVAFRFPGEPSAKGAKETSFDGLTYRVVFVVFEPDVAADVAEAMAQKLRAQGEKAEVKSVRKDLSTRDPAARVDEMRDKLSMLKDKTHLSLVLDEQAPEGTHPGRYVVYAYPDVGGRRKLTVARIVGSQHWTTWATVTGDEAEILRRDVPVARPLPERLSEYVKVFLSPLGVRGE